MNTSALKSQFYLLRSTNLPNQTANPSFLIPLKTTSLPKTRPHFSNSKQILHNPTKKNKYTDKPSVLGLKSSNFPQVFPDGYSRFVLVGAASVGFMVLLMGMDDQKAWALGPEGPLVEEFWENVRRYGLYALTVSTGALYTIFQPIFELLKNPISAVLLLVIFGGSFFILSQILTAMVGVSEFSYDYSY